MARLGSPALPCSSVSDTPTPGPDRRYIPSSWTARTISLGCVILLSAAGWWASTIEADGTITETAIPTVSSTAGPG